MYAADSVPNIPEALEILLKAGVNPNTKDDEGEIAPILGSGITTTFKERGQVAKDGWHQAATRIWCKFAGH